MRNPPLEAAATTSLFCAVLATTVGGRRCRAGWIDPDTPEKFLTTAANYHKDTRDYELVFSDEFEQDGRSFEDGADPRWTAIDKNDYTNEALHYYRSQNVRTANGALSISSILKSNLYKAFDEDKGTYFADAKHVQSGMVQGWNKFCMTGGIIEFSAKLPGDPSTGGLWPALWMLGNLARATYVGSSNYIWPYSYNRCDEKNRFSQKISACSKVGHFGMEPGVGRGSPEIDILEAMMGSPEMLPSTNITRPYFSSSLQIAPGYDGVRPTMGKMPKTDHWYEGLEYGSNKTQLNPFFYGVTLEHKPVQYTYQSDALSANTQLTKDYFRHYHKYSVEWEPPNDDGTEGYIKWYLDDNFIYGIKGENLQLTNTEIPSEPMYLLMNTAIASSWGFPKPCPDGCSCKCYECGNPECTCGLPEGFCENFPATFEIDYVRVYQAKNDPKHLIGCSTESRPTAKFIIGNMDNFVNKEDGQKVPLLPIRRGGGYCKADSECGYPTKGSCLESRRCVCEDSFTGPMCLSHAGFDDNTPPMESLEIDMVLLPPVILAMFVFAALAFVLFIVIAVWKRRTMEERYRQLPSSNGVTRLDGELVRAMQQYGLSYQQMRATPPNPFVENKQNTVTYCVIDGRLLDE
ncbi:hypothetical protein ACHAW5_009514 [Stephanodiscus triporus]|uniref:GH16 domain-containing protein n=1 Tax=Stephanodiscus triporus TaxID=2934178 RepID=A0ABD3NDN9_9STRA